MGGSENSSAIDRAPGARSKSAEFVETSILVTELQRCENAGFHFHASPFGTRIEGDMVIFKISKCARGMNPGVSANAYGSY